MVIELMTNRKCFSASCQVEQNKNLFLKNEKIKNKKNTLVFKKFPQLTGNSEIFQDRREKKDHNKIFLINK